MTTSSFSRLLLLAPLAAFLPWAGFAQEPDKPNSIFLVAKPRLQDPNFSKTVVLVTQPRADEPMGVIINRPTPFALNELFPENLSLRTRGDPVYFGGPVSPLTLVFVFHAVERPKEALPVLDDIYMSVSPGLLSQLISRSRFPERLKVYAGYAGWAPGQLQNEIRRGDWYVINADAETLFRMEPKSVWPELVKRASARSTKGSQSEGGGMLAIARRYPHNRSFDAP